MRWPVFVVCLAFLASCGSPETKVTTTTASSASAANSIEETTTLALTTTTVGTTSTISAEASLTLRGDGLGQLDFGEPTDSTFDVLVGLLGPPDPGEQYPYGDHPLRFLYWDEVGLAVIFSDHPFYRDDGAEHFAGWVHSPYIGDLAGWDHGPESLPLQTAEGIGIGSTLTDLQDAYPDQVVLEAECEVGGPPTAAYVRFDGSDADRIPLIEVSFESLPIGPTSRVAAMSAGAGPGC